jgi:3-oxoacyl-[acyl-carrier-protein] synthase II
MSLRVVVTGLGCISPLGGTFPSTYARLLSPAAEPAFRSLSDIFAGDPRAAELHLASLPCQVAAPVDCSLLLPPARKQRSRFLQFAAHAASEAVRASRLPVSAAEPSPGVGVCLGTGIGCISSILSSHDLLRKSVRKISPHFVPSILCNSAAGAVSLEHGLQGPNASPSTACATGAHAVADAFRFVRDGDATAMLAGGAEASVDPLSLAGFSRLRAMSARGADEGPSRPFDGGRDGFVMGEGAAVLVLEERGHALARGADILCEVAGYGMSGDAHHATAPDPEGAGAERAMRAALRSARIGMGDVKYVNAHATSTPLGDEAEVRAICRLAGEAAGGGGGRRGGPLLVSSTKGATGHLLGAAGALEAAFAVMACKSGSVPHTQNLREVGVGEYPGELVEILAHGEGRELGEEGCEYVMSNSFGFGGTNCCLIFSRHKD